MQFASILTLLRYFEYLARLGAADFVIRRITKRNHCNVYDCVVFVGALDNAFTIVACDHCRTATVYAHVPYEGTSGVNLPDMPYDKLARIIEDAQRLESDHEVWKLDNTI